MTPAPAGGRRPAATGAVDLTEADVARYRRDGFVVLPGVFPAGEAAAWAGECDRLQALPGVFHPDNLRTGVLNSERPPDRLDPVVDLSPLLRDVALGPRLRSLASRLLGDDAALFKDKVILKPPGTRGYDPHQDYAYWSWLPAPPAALLSVLVALDPATAANGAVELFPRLHHRLLTPEGVPADVEEADLTTRPHLAVTEPGDVVVFHSLTPHRSGPNRTGTERRQLYLSYGAAGHGDLYRTYYDHLHRVLREGRPDEARARSYFR